MDGLTLAKICKSIKFCDNCQFSAECQNFTEQILEVTHSTLIPQDILGLKEFFDKEF